MNKSKWVDSKSKGKLDGSTFDADGLKISIGHNKFCDEEIWFLNCEGLGIAAKALESKDLSEAKEQALEIVSVGLYDRSKVLADELALIIKSESLNNLNR